MATTIFCGTTQSVADDLARSASDSTRVIAVSSSNWDEATFLAVRAAIESMVTVLPQCLLAQDDKRRRALLDQLVFVPTSARITRDEIHHVISARTRILSSTVWLTADSMAARSISTSPESLKGSLEIWRRQRQCFAILHDQHLLYPAYAFDLKWARPHYVIEVILRTLINMSDWELAYWFGSVNTHLDGKRPQDLLVTDPGLVVSAAKAVVRHDLPS